ncbi:MAG: MerR family transcriptional regulator [Proteobacteria bacterium]|nr:MerR family transcriptional regulator [Pseudomonadota bacterium]
MENKKVNSASLSIPAKRYFTIGEVGVLCGVKPHVLRYWEQEFAQLKPVKRRGNRRYYQHQEVLLIRHIKELLYNQGFTINGARNRLEQIEESERIAIEDVTADAQSSVANLHHIRREIKSIVSQLLS